jgi:hypothetical protein
LNQDSNQFTTHFQGLSRIEFEKQLDEQTQMAIANWFKKDFYGIRLLQELEDTLFGTIQVDFGRAAQSPEAEKMWLVYLEGQRAFYYGIKSIIKQVERKIENGSSRVNTAFKSPNPADPTID